MRRLAGPVRALIPSIPRRLRVWSGEVATEQAWLGGRSQPESTDMEEFLSQAPPSGLRNTHYIAIALFLTLIVIASLAKVDVVVGGSGKLAADAPTMVLQPMQLSIIREIRVKAGEIVHRGDVLATLDPTFAQADWAALNTRHVALQAAIDRSDAELVGASFDLAGGGSDRELQLTLFMQRKAQYAAKLEDFSQKIEGYESDIAAAEQSRISLA